jgi:hypothetical protein
MISADLYNSGASISIDRTIIISMITIQIVNTITCVSTRKSKLIY